MSVRWRKVVGDLRTNKARSLLTVLAIAIGITGFGTVLGAYSILIRELKAGYVATNPASATLWLPKIDERVRKVIRNFKGVVRFEERRSIPARVRTETGDWKNAQIFVFPDFHDIQISKLKPQKGKWPPRDGEILIERDAIGVARAKIGDKIVVQLSNGVESSLIIAGTVHDVGQAQARMEQLVYGYVPISILNQFGMEPYLDQIKVEVAGDRWEEKQVRTAIFQLEQLLKKNGVKVLRSDIPKPGAHPHADLMGTLLIYKSSFGFLALLFSAVLVMQLVTAVMAGQVRQIGILKAVGARKSQIAAIYLTGVLVLGFSSLLLAIPASILGGRSLALFLARFLNFDFQNLTISWWVYVIQISSGLLVPFLAALYPVTRGSKINVSDALRDYGIRVAQFGNSRFDALLAQATGLTRPLLLSIRNTFRRRGRLFWILATLVMGGTIFIAAWNVRASLIHTVNVMLRSLRYDLTLTFAEYYSDIELERAIRNVAGVEQVEFWAVAEAAFADAEKGEDALTIVAAPANTGMLGFQIVEGRALTPTDPNGLVINNRLAANAPHLKVGTRVRLLIGENTGDWEIIGITRQAFSAPAAYANLDPIRRLTQHTEESKIARIVTDNHDAKYVFEVKQNLEKALASEGFRITSSVSMADRKRVIDEHNSVIYTFLIVMALLIVLVGGLGLMTMMSIQVLERRREVGVLRAIGATRRKIVTIFLAEGAFIGCLSWLMAAPLSLFISTKLGKLAAGRILHTNLEPTTDATGAILWFVVVLGFGSLASFFPAWNATQATVRELIEYE